MGDTVVTYRGLEEDLEEQERGVEQAMASIKALDEDLQAQNPGATPPPTPCKAILSPKCRIKHLC